MCTPHFLRDSLLISLLFFAPLTSFSNHLAGGYIQYDCISEGSYAVTLNIFQDCADALVVETQSLRVVPSCDFNFFSTSLTLSSNEVLTELCPSESDNALCNGGSLQSYRLLKYTGIVNVATECESFRFLFKYNYRTNSVNLSDDNWTFYVHTVVYPLAGLCNSSPRYQEPDVIQSCVGNGDQVFMTPFDPEGDSLHFELVSCLYSPSGNSFAEIPYESGYSPEAPMPGAVLNASSGLFQYGDAGPGKYAVAVQMNEYDSEGVLLCEVHLDYLVVKETCTSAGLTLGQDQLFNLSEGVEQMGPKSLSLCQGQYFCAEYVYALDDPSIQVTSSNNLDEYLSDVSVTYSNEGDSLRLIFCGKSPDEMSNFYLTFNLQDDHCPYVNFLLTEVFLQVTEASSPDLSIAFFAGELYMTDPTAGESYQWYQNGVPLDGATASSFIIENPEGMDYQLIVIDASGCIGSSNVISFPVSVSELTALAFSISPNPVTDFVSITRENVVSGSFILCIMDSQGREVLRRNLTQERNHIDVAFLAKGVYMLEIQDDHQNSVRSSFIKE